jgi:uncharacterized protein YbaP (TraB family)
VIDVPGKARLKPRVWIGISAAILVVASAVQLRSAPARNFLWKITNPQNTVYLAGSIHLLTSGDYPLSPALDAAFDHTDLLVEEADFGELLSPDTQLRLLTRGMLPAGQTLEKVLSPKTYRLVSQRVAAMGMPLEPLQRFKPWFLSLTLMSLAWQAAGFDPALGLDKHFYDRARSQGKSIQGLETVDYQISRFDELSMEQQDSLLVETFEDFDSEQASIKQLADAWRNGDVTAVEATVLKDLKNQQVLYQRLLVERNRNWLPKIEALFKRPGRALVVVGAAHLVGPDGLLALLKAKGYTVEQQ